MLFREKNGRRIGFKTANLVNSYCSLVFGYLVKIKIPKLCKNFFGIANFGVKPTFYNHSPLLEVHIFNLIGIFIMSELLSF